MMSLCSDSNDVNETDAESQDEDVIQDLDTVLMPLTIVLCVMSITFSIINVTVFTRKSMWISSFNVLLLALELANIILSVFQMSFSIIVSKYGQFIGPYAVVVFEIIVFSVAITAAYFTNWLTVAIGLWRFIAVTTPLKSKVLLTRKRAAVIIGVFLAFCTVPAVYIGTGYHIDGDMYTCDEDNVMSTVIYSLQARSNDEEWLGFNEKIIVTINIVYYLCPCIFFLVITLSLILHMVHIRRQMTRLREGQDAANRETIKTTIILIVLMSMFLVSNTLPLVIRLVFISGGHEKDETIYYVLHILSSYPLTLITNIMSIFAYYNMGTKFRETFHSLICFSRILKLAK